jgi:lipopolysaccharide export system permease protein
MPGDRDLIGATRDAFSRLISAVSDRFMNGRTSTTHSSGGMRFVLFQLLDSYVLSSFLFYFFVLLSSFVMMTQVFTFFDLLGDIVKNHVPMSHVLTYHLFLTPKLIYDTLPVSVLVAVLVTFGVMTKNNEVTAFKACGVSVRRLGLPVLLMSSALSAGLFAFDHYYIPQANQIQDAIRNEIKGRPVQTYLHPERKWIIHENRIFYYKYFDPSEKVMVDPYVFELSAKPFRLNREINATRARWQPDLRTWVWEKGVVRDICGVTECKVQEFTVTSFPELTETPDDFLKEVKQDKQMNYLELRNYIDDLQRSGFDTVRLRVQFYKKFSVPLFAVIMALISVPFGFLVGNRGAMAGIGVSIAIAMAYWGIGQLFEQIGNVNQLPPAVAAWAPDALFSLAGLYFMVRMRS